MSPFVFDPKRYPTTPGCYLMKEDTGRVIYVGKAKDLRKRLCSYFNHSRKRGRTRRLVERIAGIEVILVNSEVESLILENNLIKRYKPRFNVLLKAEDEGYHYIVLTDEPFPRFVPYKKHRVNRALDGLGERGIARRFGPYPSWRFRTTLLDYVNETFLLRQCHPMPAYACLLHHMHKCSAPCEALIVPEDYAEAVKRAVQFLARPPVGAVRAMRERMLAYAERMEYERAARIREQLKVMTRALSLQVVERDVRHDQDVIWFSERAATVLSFRCGALVGIAHEHVTTSCVEFLCERYADEAPVEIIVNGVDRTDECVRALTRLRQQRQRRRVKLTVPKKGVGVALLKLAQRNHDYRQSESHRRGDEA